MRRKKLYVFCILIMISLVLKSQSFQPGFLQNIHFADYLIRNNLTDDALVLLKSILSQNKLSSSQKDTINCYIANLYYNKEQFE